MRRVIASMCMAAGICMPAFAAQDTVQSLLASGFTAVSSISSQAGPGIFLQKQDKLFLCFVSETPSSSDVSTRYCKPVH
jgi:hypothetical protein